MAIVPKLMQTLAVAVGALDRLGTPPALDETSRRHQTMVEDRHYDSRSGVAWTLGQPGGFTGRAGRLDRPSDLAGIMRRAAGEGPRNRPAPPLSLG
jgi:hypothetical protein